MKHILIKKKDLPNKQTIINRKKSIINGRFKMNLSKTDITLKKAMETRLGIVYKEEIDEAFFDNNQVLLHKLLTLCKEHIYG